MTDKEKLRNRLKPVGLQVGSGLFMIVFGTIDLLEDYIHVALKKDGADMFWTGIAMLCIGCLLIGAAADAVARALQSLSDQ